MGLQISTVKLLTAEEESLTCSRCDAPSPRIAKGESYYEVSCAGGQTYYVKAEHKAMHEIPDPTP